MIGYLQWIRLQSVQNVCKVCHLENDTILWIWLQNILIWLYLQCPSTHQTVPIPMSGLEFHIQMCPCHFYVQKYNNQIQLHVVWFETAYNSIILVVKTQVTYCQHWSKTHLHWRKTPFAVCAQSKIKYIVKICQKKKVSKKKQVYLLNIKNVYDRWKIAIYFLTMIISITYCSITQSIMSS